MLKQKQDRSRPGFTIIELLVTIGIIGLLAALLFPAVMMMRENARKTLCVNNLKQIGVALHNYHDTYKVFPPGQIRSNSGGPVTTGTGWSWGTMILPFIEQDTIFKKISFSEKVGAQSGTAAVTNLEMVAFTLPYMRCPSEGSTLRKPVVSMNSSSDPFHITNPGIANTSYYANAGAFKSFDSSNKNEQNGVIFINSKISLDDVQRDDGTTYTILIGEAAKDHSFSDGYYYGATGPNGEPCCEETMMRNGQFRLNFGKDLTVNDGSRKYGFSSMHRGGANFLFVDGKVKFFPENIDHTASSDTTQAALGSGCQFLNSECSDDNAAPGNYKDQSKLKLKYGLYQQHFGRNDKINIKDGF